MQEFLLRISQGHNQNTKKFTTKRQSQQTHTHTKKILITKKLSSKYNTFHHQSTIPFKVVPGTPASIFIENFPSLQPKHKIILNENTVLTNPPKKFSLKQKFSSTHKTFRGGARESRERFC